MLLNCGVGEGSWESLGIARRPNQSILEEISPEYPLAGLMLKLKLQYFSHLMQRTDSLEKTLMLRKDWKLEEKQTTEDEMVGWYHRLNAYEFEQTHRDSEGQGSLACCCSRGHTEMDTTEWLNFGQWDTAFLGFIFLYSVLENALRMPRGMQVSPCTFPISWKCILLLLFFLSHL